MRTPLLVTMFGLLVFGLSGCIYGGYAREDYAYPAGYYGYYGYYDAYPVYPWGWWGGGHFHGHDFHGGRGHDGGFGRGGGGGGHR